MSVLYFVIGAFLRRWFGGGFAQKYKFMSWRGLQTACMLVAFLTIFVDDVRDWREWVVAVVISCWLQFQYLSRAHGCCFDIGRGGEPSESTIKRYNERWYHIPCDFLFNKLFRRPDKKYGFLYDFLYMELRYTCPMLPMIYFDWRYVLIGLSIAPAYAFCWTLWEQEDWIRPEREWLDKPVKWAELWIGGITYMGCYILN